MRFDTVDDVSSFFNALNKNSYVLNFTMNSNVILFPSNIKAKYWVIAFYALQYSLEVHASPDPRMAALCQIEMWKTEFKRLHASQFDFNTAITHI